VEVVPRLADDTSGHGGRHLRRPRSRWPRGASPSVGTNGV